MAGTWLRITVELLSGRGQDLEPPPGRVFLASGDHTFDALARAINNGFARWDHAHLYAFTLPTGEVIGLGHEDAPEDELVAHETRLRSFLKGGTVFDYVFDFGDDWTHSCRVESTSGHVVSKYGLEPDGPVPIWGWGTIPDQYGREGPDD